LLYGKIDAMREIVDRILQEEQSARSSIERAQNQSQEIILKAKEEAISLIQNAVNKAKDRSKGHKEESEKTFLAEKEKMLSAAKENAALSRSRAQKDMAKRAGEIFSQIITIKG
jgi:hypothetical protein